ncbi:MAG: MerR family transcriptional regulator [Deltaproteobacteria bacterium]|nr:MerR family transcriptional regulator [Deltaproteobacteria bacterium]
MGIKKLQLPVLDKTTSIIVADYIKGDYNTSIKLLRNKVYKVKNTQVSYRTINHWAQEGILNEEERTIEDRKWRTFSLLELFWLNIVVKLRSFGMPLNPILKCKQEMFMELEDGFTNLDFAFFHCARITHYDLFLVVFYDGDSYILTREDLEQNEIENRDIFDSYLLINFNRLFFNSIPSAPAGAFTTFSDFRTVLKKSEKEIVDVIRDNEISHVKVYKKSGKIDRYEKTRVISNTDNLWKDGKDIPFGTITMKRKDGKITYLEITESKKS